MLRSTTKCFRKQQQTRQACKDCKMQCDALQRCRRILQTDNKGSLQNKCKRCGWKVLPDIFRFCGPDGATM